MEEKKHRGRDTQYQKDMGMTPGRMMHSTVEGISCISISFTFQVYISHYLPTFGVIQCLIITKRQIIIIITIIIII